MKVTNVEQMRALERRVVEEFAIPELLLRENAGRAAASVIEGALGRRLRAVVVCGLGINGGVGLVVARQLHAGGAERVRALVTGGVDGYDASSRQHLEMALRAGVEVTTDATAEQVRLALDEGCDVVVDALVGAGLSGDVKERDREVIEAINASGRQVVSLDLPSGVDGDTGLVRGAAVRARWTVSFGLPKLGNLLYPGFDLGGRLLVSHVSLPPALTGSAELLVEAALPPPLPPRRADGHKGSFGDVLFIAGASSYYGAPSLAALSLLKAGGGYSRLAAPRSVVPHLAPLASEVVFLPQEETAEGAMALTAAEALLAAAEGVDLVVLGPGLSLADETQQLVRRLVAELDKPLVLDGDGLTAMAGDVDVLRRREALTALTPHPGEMSRLSGRSVSALRADPVAAVRDVSHDLGAHLVLKGPHSLICGPDGRAFINLSGNSGMGTAGSGDVLTGAIGAAFGLGLELGEALRAGVFLHGLAGDLAAEGEGEDGMTARDVLEHLPAAVRRYRADYEAMAREHYGAITVV